MDEIKGLIQEGFNKIANVTHKHKLINLTEVKRLQNVTMITATMRATDCKKDDPKPIESCSLTVSHIS